MRLRAGDVVLLTGDLGAGKTTLMRGVGRGHGRARAGDQPHVRDRAPASLAWSVGPRLVHADAYRLGSAGEFEDLDLDTDDAVVCVEWGRDRAEGLSDQRLEIDIETVRGRPPGDDPRGGPGGPAVILAMDTSTPHCTVAFDGRSAGVVAPTGHAEHLADLIRQVVPDVARSRPSWPGSARGRTPACGSGW